VPKISRTLKYCPISGFNLDKMEGFVYTNRVGSSKKLESDLIEAEAEESKTDEKSSEITNQSRSKNLKAMKLLG
jgi:hypothetical protein